LNGRFARTKRGGEQRSRASRVENQTTAPLTPPRFELKLDFERK
jgi:hypothetical protein